MKICKCCNRLECVKGYGRKETLSFVSKRHGGLRASRELRISHGDHLLFSPSVSVDTTPYKTGGQTVNEFLRSGYITIIVEI